MCDSWLYEPGVAAPENLFKAQLAIRRAEEAEGKRGQLRGAGAAAGSSETAAAAAPEGGAAAPPPLAAPAVSSGGAVARSLLGAATLGLVATAAWLL